MSARSGAWKDFADDATEMCLMVYMAAHGDVALGQAPELRVEDVEPSRQAVRQWFSLPVVRFIGAHTGCSCGFPSVISDEPIEYYDGMFSGEEDRSADLESVESLLALVRSLVTATGELQLYPVADGDEGQSPKGVITLSVDALDRDTFFFNERFLYRVTAEAER